MDQLAEAMRKFSDATPIGTFKWEDMAHALRQQFTIVDRESLARALFDALTAWDSEGWDWTDLTQVTDLTLWIESSGPVDLREFADRIIKALSQ